MSGNRSRRKGARRELEVAELLPGAVKISRMYQPGADLIWRSRLIEVKARADGFKFDYRHLRDVSLLAKKADRQPWLITMELTTMLDMLDETSEPAGEVQWCVEHGHGDLRRAHGALVCGGWQPDDPCVIERCNVIRVTDTGDHGRQR